MFSQNSKQLFENMLGKKKISREWQVYMQNGLVLMT